MPDELQLLTNSRMATARMCHRKDYYKYELGLRSKRTATPLRVGSAVHLGLALWSQGHTSDQAILSATDGYSTVPGWADPYDWAIESATVAALLAGYFWRYSNDPIIYIEVEKTWTMPLVNPESGAASRTFQLAGKRDGLVRRGGDNLQVLERKTAGEDIGPESEYWLRLRYDQQISLYTLSARHDGHDVAGVLYDVIRKPTIAPRQIPRLDENGDKVVLDDTTGARVLNKTGKPRQTGGEGMTLQTCPETPEEFGARLLQDISDRPDYYYQRREVPRLDDDLETFRWECWQQARLIADCRRYGRWFRNVSRYTCSNCEYAHICLQSVAVDPAVPPDGFEYVADKNPELKGEDA